MSDWGTVNGARIVEGSLSLPLYGLWVADVSLASDALLPTVVSLAVGNLSLVGAVYRQAAFGGRLEARLVGGAAGWHKPVQARAYNNPGGVALSQVLRDAAIEVGESVNVISDGPIGNFFFRYADKASRVLRTLAGPLWWVSPDGTTQVGARPATSVTTDFTTEAFAGASGTLSIGSEDPASWLPGAAFSSPQVGTQTVASVRHQLGADGKARMQIMAA